MRPHVRAELKTGVGRGRNALREDVRRVCAQLGAPSVGHSLGGGAIRPVLLAQDPLGRRLAGLVEQTMSAADTASLRERDFRLAHQIARIGMWQADLRSHIVVWSVELHDLFGTDPDVFRPTFEGALLLVLQVDRAAVEAAYARVRQTGEPGDVEFRTAGPKGAAHWLRAEFRAERNTLGEVIGLRGIVQDITERKRALEHLRYLSQFDALTGLSNRARLAEQLTHDVTLAQRRRQRIAVHVLDLDGFKIVNDLHGHAMGDRLLIELSRRMGELTSAGDTIARLGGDEFAIVQVAIDDADDARRLTERLVARLAEPVDLGGIAAAVTISVGIALFPDDIPPQSAEGAASALMAAAEVSRSRIKGGVRNGYAFFQPGLDGQYRERLAFEQDLRLALARDELSLAYQPQADAGSGAVLGFEALLRWQHPLRGMVSPSEFIPVAEATGLIVTIGAWVLRQACKEAASWAVPLRIAVNVSALQIQQDDLPDLVRSALRQSGLAPARLELEVTESALLSNPAYSQHGNPNHVIQSLHKVRAMGVRLAMDDFGTGYSSLASLRAFPFDKIKLDRGFVADLGLSDGADAIVRAVLGLGRGLNLPVIAEGVETSGQADALRREGCKELQGYLIGRPLPITSYQGVTAPVIEDPIHRLVIRPPAS